MTRTLIVLAALTATIGTPAFAQKAAAPAGVLAQPSGVMLADHTMRASKLIGMPVYNDQGETVGKVEDIVVTAGAVEPTVVVSVGSFLGGADKLVIESLSQLKLGAGDKMMMPGATKAALTAKPDYSWSYGLTGGGG